MGLNMVTSSESLELATGNTMIRNMYMYIFIQASPKGITGNIFTIFTSFTEPLIAKTKTKDLKTQRNGKMDVGTKM